MAHPPHRIAIEAIRTDGAREVGQRLCVRRAGGHALRWRAILPLLPREPLVRQACCETSRTGCASLCRGWGMSAIAGASQYLRSGQLCLPASARR
eukprot:3677200-Prymnesium_polylepis.1